MAETTNMLWVDRFVYWSFRHWLFLLLCPLLFFSLLPFVAPIFMALGWTSLGKLIYTIYIPSCHQYPQRSWFFFGEKLTYTLAEISEVFTASNEWELRGFYGTPEMGWKVAWSDRMISFYTMTPVFGLFYALLRRWYGQIKPIHWSILLFMLLPMFVDGITHAVNDTLYSVFGSGLRDTNEWLATATGDRWPEFYAGDHLGTFNWWARLFTGLLAAWGVAFYTFPWLEEIIQETLEPSN